MPAAGIAGAAVRVGTGATGGSAWFGIGGSGGRAVSATWNGASGSGAAPGGGGTAVAVGAMGLAPPPAASLPGVAASAPGAAAAAGASLPLVGTAGAASLPAVGAAAAGAAAAAAGVPGFNPWVATTPPVTSMASPRAAAAAVTAPRRRFRVGPVAVVVTSGSGTAPSVVGVTSSGSGWVVSSCMLIAATFSGCSLRTGTPSEARAVELWSTARASEANATDAGTGRPVVGQHRPSRCPVHPRASGSWCWWVRVPPQRWLRDPCRFGTE